MQTYKFTLLIAFNSSYMDEIEDSLFEAGCDDALVNYRNGSIYLDFMRDSDSFENAIIYAINDVESTP